MNQGGNEKAPEQDLTGLTSTIQRKICKDAKKTDSLFSSACIYRVPKELRKVKESAYIPRLIAIGPLHRKDKHLKTPFQGIKMSYTTDLLCRLTTVKMEESEKKYEYSTVLQDCVKEMKDCVDEAKQCYAEELNLSNGDMLEMMLVDGCFILELLYRSFDESKSKTKEAKNIPKEEGQEGKRNGTSTSSDLSTPLLQDN
ncbi:hypothetical protein RHGRI_038947 [Rhododendron griersonianum]|uniref:Uncharacterized protein n=1 Tax=Rhododendron griersonianum TaxID=479676 RepID=A0AAV6HIB8_9ERIC|nr:hypothetical protein RHGRI_038947 [Rhododendron griersonianum]